MLANGQTNHFPRDIRSEVRFRSTSGFCSNLFANLQRLRIHFHASLENHWELIAIITFRSFLFHILFQLFSNCSRLRRRAVVRMCRTSETEFNRLVFLLGLVRQRILTKKFLEFLWSWLEKSLVRFSKFFGSGSGLVNLDVLCWNCF